MRTRKLVTAVAGLMVLAASPGVVEAAEAPFEEAALRFEQNATDGDYEVVLVIKSGNRGCDRLSVEAPGGRTVFELVCPEPAMLGLRQFTIESPEPPNRATVVKGFPEGTYVIRGRRVDGVELESTAELTHELPPTTGFVHPAEDAEDVVHEDLVIRWDGPSGIAGLEIEIEDEESGALVFVTLPAHASSFSPPAGFLEEGATYTLAIGTVAESGNKSFVETSFTTAE